MATTSDSLTAKQAATTAQQAAQQPPADQVDTSLPERFTVVPVRAEAPAQAIPRTLNLSSTNPALPLLPQDPRRRVAQVTAVTAGVWICGSLELATASEGLATGGFGFYLPVGVMLPITAKSAFWVAWNDTATQVSVLVERDDE